MADDPIRNKVAIVTGSTKGIGLATAELLLGAGAKVMISARTAPDVDRTVERLGQEHPGRVSGRPCDVRREADVEALFEEAERLWGGLDIVVNNAGVGHQEALETMTLESWNRVMETNVTGVFLCARAAIPRLRARGGGYVINISSLAGKTAFPGASAYNASKFAVNGLSEALFQEVRYDGIRVSYIMPGSVNTYFGGTSPDPAAGWKLTAEDVAQVVVDLVRHDPRSLPSRVELRPSRPPRK